MKNITISCRCCNEVAEKIFNAKLLNNDIQYFECKKCEYVQTEVPYWLDEAYANPINTSDTGVMERNVLNARLVQMVLKLLKIQDSTVVDFAGGYGILVRLLRDRGIQALWSDGYCKNLLSGGFEFKTQTAELVTAFEVFEHFVNPQIELKKLFAIAPNVLLSTLIIPKPIPASADWWYYGLEHGQHIGFYSLETLRYLATTQDKYLYTDGNSIHLMTTKKLSNFAWKSMLFKLRILAYIKRKTTKSLIISDFNYMQSSRVINNLSQDKKDL